jgi:hypothetical protein
MFYDLKRLGITPDVFICALFGYSINIRICLVYNEVFRSSPEKCIILNNKTNEICNSGNSTQNFEELRILVQANRLFLFYFICMVQFLLTL